MAKRRYATRARGLVENQKVDEFLDQIAAVCRRHGLTLAYEDGAFLAEDFDPDHLDHLLDATDHTGLDC